MRFFFYFILTLFIIILQTTFLPKFQWFDKCFDLTIITIIYLSISFSNYSLTFFIILIGCLLDSMSGHPFFYYTFSYLWIFFIVQIMRKIVFSRSIIFILIISLSSVLIEHFLLILLSLVSYGKEGLLNIDYILMLSQLINGIIFIPPLLWFVNTIFELWMLSYNSMKKRILIKIKDDY